MEPQQQTTQVTETTPVESPSMVEKAQNAMSSVQNSEYKIANAESQVKSMLQSAKSIFGL